MVVATFKKIIVDWMDFWKCSNRNLAAAAAAATARATTKVAGQRQQHHYMLIACVSLVKILDTDSDSG